MPILVNGIPITAMVFKLPRKGQVRPRAGPIAPRSFSGLSTQDPQSEPGSEWGLRLIQQELGSET